MMISVLGFIVGLIMLGMILGWQVPVIFIACILVVGSVVRGLEKVRFDR